MVSYVVIFGQFSLPQDVSKLAMRCFLFLTLTDLSRSVITLTNKRPSNNLYYSVQMDGAQ